MKAPKRLFNTPSLVPGQIARFTLFNMAFLNKTAEVGNKYLNNIIEQDHRFIKKRTRPMLGFKSFRSAKITISGIENIRIIQKGQIIGSNNNTSTFENFKMLMAS